MDNTQRKKELMQEIFADKEPNTYEKFCSRLFDLKYIDIAGEIMEGCITDGEIDPDDSTTIKILERIIRSNLVPLDQKDIAIRCLTFDNMDLYKKIYPEMKSDTRRLLSYYIVHGDILKQEKFSDCNEIIAMFCHPDSSLDMGVIKQKITNEYIPRLGKDTVESLLSYLALLEYVTDDSKNMIKNCMVK